MMKYLTACAALYLSLSAAALGCELEVTDPWIREAPPTATALAGYMVLANRGSEDCVVTGVRAKGIGRAMFHRTEQKGGMAHMTHQDEVNVPAGGSIVFEPNGLHIMLMKPQQALKQGDRVAVTLLLEDGSEKETAFPVRGSR